MYKRRIVLTIVASETLAQLADRLLGILQEKPGQFVGRGKLAKRIGKTRLNARDVSALEYLAETGRIEMKKFNDPRPLGFRYEYRSK